MSLPLRLASYGVRVTDAFAEFMLFIAILARIKISSLPPFSCSLVLCYSLELVGTFGVELICNNTPGLTDRQRQVCMQMPEAMLIMNDVSSIFQNECTWQFKTNRWNCSGVVSPIYSTLDMEGENCAARLKYDPHVCSLAGEFQRHCLDRMHRAGKIKRRGQHNSGNINTQPGAKH